MNQLLLPEVKLNENNSCKNIKNKIIKINLTNNIDFLQKNNNNNNLE